MKRTALAVALTLAAFSAGAKDKLIPLSQGDAEALAGKTVALTLHERPTFTAMTAGKAGFGLFGVAAMTAAGNKLVDENQVADPASLVRSNLATALSNTFGAKLLESDGTPTKAKKAKELAALHPEADYVLDVRSGGWSYVYFPTQWGKYWVGYSVQVQLVDTKTSRQVSNAACNTSTHENPKPPTRDQLHENGAQLLKDVTAGLGWTCVQLLAKEQFGLKPDQVAATPDNYVDPLARIVVAPDLPEGSAEGSATPVATQDAGAPVPDAPASPEATPAGPSPADVDASSGTAEGSR